MKWLARRWRARRWEKMMLSEECVLARAPRAARSLRAQASPPVPRGRPLAPLGARPEPLAHGGHQAAAGAQVLAELVQLAEHGEVHLVLAAHGPHLGRVGLQAVPVVLLVRRGDERLERGHVRGQ
eukprot:CAMPEP_0206012442 /NCGR_PEP_ID=MMETSP1464-20131121/14848_1 /ASSEMBLY_ACC=CAM_ASM_001124 /TAXON_ID=119497 /ORGANISM="Exanthemachrysis gayraliae, Strain RCC1523" /LENGTH=124 /DNA_ID=CAMNT_0053386125 /DNA_START=119 /DNA_END=490 /DNA_ORIENTATION=-